MMIDDVALPVFVVQIVIWNQPLSCDQPLVKSCLSGCGDGSLHLTIMMMLIRIMEG